ncbi:MAG: hypothetical protein ACI30J_02560 [Paludibacteraceae bacterium]
MKKLCFIAATLVAMLLGMSGCTTSETTDVVVYYLVSFRASGGTLTPETEGLNSTELSDVFKTHLLTLGEKLGDNSVVIRRQSNEKNVKQAILQATQDADAELKAKYGDPVTVQQKYSHLSITVYYGFGDNPDVTVATYTYKE